jgi:16S rRNA (cytosine967-C5)-methyltransferase
MTPAARVQAAMDILDLIIESARDNGPAADVQIAGWFKTRRFAGSGDRRAIRELVYRAIRSFGERPWSGREAFVGLAQQDADLAALFTGGQFGPALLDAGEPAAHASPMPSWLKSELSPLIGAEEQAALLGRAGLDLRANTLKTDRAAMLAVMEGAVAIPHSDAGLRIEEPRDISNTPEYRDGLIEVQDAGSQYISAACKAAPGMTVVDLCAGAGGKTLALAADMQGKGKLIACDAVRSRLSQLQPRADRAGAGFIETLLIDGGRERQCLAGLRNSADVVLVDGPCSSAGTWRRNPEARWRMTRERLAATARLQAELLRIGAELVRPGGALVYAVCSVLTREGQDQIAAFLDDHHEWFAQDIDLPMGRAAGNGRLLTPLHDGTDGFFVARLEKA